MKRTVKKNDRHLLHNHIRLRLHLRCSRRHRPLGGQTLTTKGEWETLMTKLMANLEPVIAAELSEANRNHPLFASRHDGAAVIREEVEEAEETMRTVSDIYGELWHDIKHDNYMYLTEDIQHLREAAKNLAGEAVQVAAMCDK